MLRPHNLKSNPCIITTMDYPHSFVPPPIGEALDSDWLYMSIDNGSVEKIYAMRVMPIHDLVAFKIKYTYEDGPESLIVSRPDLAVLKMIWDCNNPEFNKAIEHYLQHSKHALFQFGHKKQFPFNTAETNSWFFSITLGRHV